MSEQSAPPQEQTDPTVVSSDPQRDATTSSPVAEAPEASETPEASDVEQAATDAATQGAAASEPTAEHGPEATADSDADDGEARSSQVARLEREGEVAADFLEQLLDIADLDGDLDVDVDGDRAAVAIVDSDEGRVPRRLVGDHAKVLEALQELTRLAVQSATGERSRLMLDVAGYRADRRAALVQTAREAIEQVRASGERTMLDPMTAFERKVVHDEVLAAGLSSESEGVEPHRCVVILPR